MVHLYDTQKKPQRIKKEATLVSTPLFHIKPSAYAQVWKSLTPFSAVMPRQ